MPIRRLRAWEGLAVRMLPTGILERAGGSESDRPRAKTSPDDQRQHDADWNADPEAALAEAARHEREQQAGGDGEADEADGQRAGRARPPTIQRTGTKFLRLALGEIAAQRFDDGPDAEAGEADGDDVGNGLRADAGIGAAAADAARVPGDDGRQHQQPGGNDKRRPVGAALGL